MRHFRNIFFALAAFLWLPASAHCQLETFLGLEILACPAEIQAGADNDSHCPDNGCCSVEHSSYQAGLFRPSVTAEQIFLQWQAPAEVFPLPLDAAHTLVPPPAPPPPLPTCWQFSLRTALPPRAPSIVA